MITRFWFVSVYIATRYCFMRLIFSGNFEIKEQLEYRSNDSDAFSIV